MMLGLILTFLFTVWAAAYKIMNLVEIFGARPRFTQVLRSLLVSAAFNSILPGRLGDLHRISLLARIPHLKAAPFMIVLLERYLDIGVILGLLSTVTFFSSGRHAPWIEGVSLGLVIFQGILWVGLSKWSGPTPLIASLNRMVLVWLDCPRLYVKTLGWGALSWGLNMSLLTLALHSCFPFVPIRDVVAAGALGVAAGLSPIGVNGLGVREAVLIYCFPLLNPAGVIQAGLIYFAFTAVPMIIAGVVTISLGHWSKYKN